MDFSKKILPIEILEELGKMLWHFSEHLVIKYRVVSKTSIEVNCKWNKMSDNQYRPYMNAIDETDFISIYSAKTFVDLKIALVKRAASKGDYKEASRKMLIWFSNSIGSTDLDTAKKNIEAIVMYASSESDGMFKRYK